MKKLLQINTVVNTGSTGRIAEEIGLSAIKYGWESYIAFARNERPSQSKLLKIGNYFDINIHALQTRLFDRHGLGSQQSTVKLIEKIKKIQPDIIHLHNLHGYYLNLKVLFTFLAKARINIVWTLHDCWVITGHCTNFEFTGCEKWKTRCYACPQKREYPASYGLDRSEKNYLLKKGLFTSVDQMTIVPVSNWLRDLVSQSFLNNFPVQVIHNGINTTVFKPIANNEVLKKYRLEAKFVILGVASIWSSRKGLSDFIELSKNLDNNTITILVGLSPSQISSLPPNIIGITRTENVNELAMLYSLADVFVNPTWEDNFPTTNLESLACGTPVITYNTGGSIESVSPETGHIVQKGNIKELIDAIENIKMIGKGKYSTACIERAKKLYNQEDRYLEYLNLYDSILNKT